MQGGHFIAEESESQSSLHILSLEIPTVSVTEKLLLLFHFSWSLRLNSGVTLKSLKRSPYYKFRLYHTPTAEKGWNHTL